MKMAENQYNNQYRNIRNNMKVKSIENESENRKQMKAMYQNWRKRNINVAKAYRRKRSAKVISMAAAAYGAGGGEESYMK